MNTTCKQCKKTFIINKNEEAFYDMVKSPLPDYCSTCRATRRLAFRNERTLYRRSCDLCSDSIVSIYQEKTLFPVYCPQCWWSDNWDPNSIYQNYDLSKNFFDQFIELKNKVPRIGLLSINNVNSPYVNNSADNKNGYLIFAAEQNEDSMYSRLIMNCKNVSDCAFVYESEFCYECVDVTKSYKCMYLESSDSCTEIYFSYDMRNSNNCIFSTNCRNASYMVYNKKVTKEEFEKKKQEIFSTYETIEHAKKEFDKIKKQAIKKFAHQVKCNNITGSYLHNCHDGVELFDTRDSKNASYLSDTEGVIDSMDLNNCYYKPERAYDTMGILQGNNIKHCIYVFYSMNIEYCDSCYNLQDCFGCVGIKKGSYMILNKQYSKEDYKELKEKIISNMKVDGVYGQFFPPEMSPFGYNETLANEYYPMTRDEALSKGYRWQEKSTGIFGKETIASESMPQNIINTPDSIVDDILLCVSCDKNFRITEEELAFYRRMNIPIPHQDFECRHQSRMNSRTSRKLHTGSCSCTKTTHMHTGPCTQTFETPYSDDTPVFCEQCYLQEVA